MVIPTPQLDPNDPQIVYLREALHRALQEGETLATTFYDELFTRYPQTRDLFDSDPEHQRKMFIAVLVFAAQELETPEHLSTRLRELGEAHRRNGVSASALEMGRQPFLTAIRSAIGVNEYQSQKHSWDGLYSLLLMGMRDSG